MLIHEIVEFAARRSPEQAALVFDPGGVQWTFAELHDRASRMASVLRERVGPGQRLAVLSHNTADYVTLFAAASMAGVGLVLLNQRLHRAEWADQIERSDPQLIVGEAQLLAEVDATCCDWAELSRAVEQAVADPPKDAAHDDRALAWLIYTSGTTGRPKGAMLTHRSLLAATVNAAIGRPVSADDVYLFPFPLCHVAAYNVLIHHLHARPVVLLERFETKTLLDAVEKHHVTSVSLAPTMISALLDDPAVDVANLSSLKQIGYGASAIPPDVLRRGLARLGCDFAQGYGMTEMSGNGVFLDADHHRRAAGDEPELLAKAGRPGPLASISLAADGEILVKGDQVFAGYWDDQPATDAAFTDDGWFRTGDIGSIDDDGLLSVIDRKKDMVVTGGENVSSREVEDVLHDHPAVAQVAVIGVPDEHWGEIVTAVVLVRDATLVTADELIEHCRGRLASYKKPRRVVFVDELPVNAGGKILKRELRERFC